VGGDVTGADADCFDCCCCLFFGGLFDCEILVLLLLLESTLRMFPVSVCVYVDATDACACACAGAGAGALVAFGGDFRCGWTSCDRRACRRPRRRSTDVSPSVVSEQEDDASSSSLSLFIYAIMVDCRLSIVYHTQCMWIILVKTRVC
jgi:hypothetical protein